MEWAVEFAASVCLHLNKAGQHVRLVSEHGRLLADAPEEAGASHAGAVLEALAVLQPGHARDIVLGSDPGQGQELIAVLGTVGTESVHEITRHSARGTRNLAVLLDTIAWESSDTPADGDVAVEDTATLLRAAGWGVVVVKPEHSVADVWAQLCRTTTPGASLIGGVS